jgi:cytochrome o ubiquinol oxidase operon protein cyoD
MSEERSLREIQKDWPQTLKLYLIGFVLSFSLTCLSFLWRPSKIILLFLAVVQAFVQLIFFMHFGQEAKPRWMSLVFYFMVLVLIIIVLGSLWIMFDLDERMMPM